MRSTRYKILPYESARYQPDNSPDFLQWWYFDAEFENGYHLMVIMLPRAFGEVEKDKNGPTPAISLTITSPDLRNHHSRVYYTGAFAGDPDSMRVEFGKNIMECREGRYRLKINQEELGCDLEYIPELPPWPPFPGEGGYMSKSLVWANQWRDPRGKYFHYAAMIPRGRVQGRLILSGQTVEVKGLGYHEQGRANVRYPDVFTYWYWTRFFIGDWTFIFPAAEATRSALHTKMRALLIYYRNELVADVFDVSGFYLSHLVDSYQQHSASGREIPHTATFSARRSGLTLKADFELFHERECFCFRPFGAETPLTPVWLQHLMNVEVDINLKGDRVNLSGKGVFETMLTGAK